MGIKARIQSIEIQLNRRLYACRHFSIDFCLPAQYDQPCLLLESLVGDGKDSEGGENREFSLLGASLGGQARADLLPSDRKREIARNAALAKWARWRKERETNPPPAMEKIPKEIMEGGDDDSPMESPYARLRGQLKLGTNEVDCYVLDTGERVISLTAAVRAIAASTSGDLARYVQVESLEPYLSNPLVVAQSLRFRIPGLPQTARGITAEQFIDICNAYVTALDADALKTEKQREIAIKCAILMASCAKVGLIALIDEATGNQYDRPIDALQMKLQAFIAEELRDWEKTFPDQLWAEFGRLTGWKGSLQHRPKWWGKMIMELIYSALDPDVATHLRTTKPPPRHGRNYHQWLTADFGLKALVTHIYQIIGIAKTCLTMSELREKVALHYGKQAVQMTMYLPITKNLTLPDRSSIIRSG